MASSPFTTVMNESANRPRNGSVNQLQYSTPNSQGGVTSAKSPLSTGAVNRSGTSHAGSPARMFMMANGNDSSLGAVPSPATIANIAATAEIYNPLEASGREGIGAKIQDPYAEMLANVEAFMNVGLNQLELAGKNFFDLFEGALDEHTDLKRVGEAHQMLIATYDQLLITATQLGLAALPCPISDGNAMSALKSSDLDEVHKALINETQGTFKRRERLREGTSMVTGILTQNQWRKTK
jgi:hypothetical protein